jgi:transcriptional regulator with XRE-family HTH domain
MARERRQQVPAPGMNVRILEARKGAEFSKTELARVLGVSPTSCISWELPPDNRNATRPSVDNLVKLAVVLNVRFEWLATGRGPRHFDAASQNNRPDYGPGGAFMSEDQRALLAAYASLPANKRRALLELVGSLSEPEADNATVRKPD